MIVRHITILLSVFIVGFVQYSFAENEQVLLDSLQKKCQRYYLDEKPYNGNAWTFFENGDPSAKYSISSGYISLINTYGYEGELITETIYEEIELTCDFFDRAVLITETEFPETVSYFMLIVVNDSDYNQCEFIAKEYLNTRDDFSDNK